MSTASSTTELKGDLQKAMNNAQDAQQNPSKYDPKQSNSQPDALWNAIEPMFRFHDQIAKFLLENEEAFKIPILSSAKKTIEDSIDDLTYKFLAFFIEPAVKVMRDAVKNSKEVVESQDRGVKGYVDIWGPDALGSDPSHSVLSKDHYSNVLNPVAGRVSLALINCATQKVVRTWEDLSLDPTSVVNSILEGFHHPYYMKESSDVQNAMYSAVTSWWETRTEDKKRFLSRVLTKEGVRANQNNPVVSAADYANDPGSHWSFLGSLPETRQRPSKAIGPDITRLIEQAGQLISNTLGQIDRGVVQVSNTIGEGVDMAGHTLDDFSNSVYGTVNTALTDGRNTIEQGGQQLMQEASNLGNQVMNEGNRFVNAPTSYVNEAAEDLNRNLNRGVNELGNQAEDAAREIGSAWRSIWRS